jgi:hypothetical protein
MKSMTAVWLPFMDNYRTFLVNDGVLLNALPLITTGLLTSLDHMETGMTNPSAQEL